MVSVFPTVRNGGIFNASSLDLQFARTKTLDPRVTFTRASSGTFVGSDGLIKTATTNLLLQSEDFSTTWVNTSSSETTNAAVAPNGTQTADKLIANNGTALANADINQLVSKAATATTYTASIFAKSAEFNRVALLVSDNANIANRAAVTVSLTNGSVVSAAAALGTFTAASSSQVSLGDGWYRVSLTLTSSTETGLRFRVYTGDSVATTGDGTSGIYLWGAQLEESSTVGEYIPTTSTINSAPRFDHNPTTGESLGLLVEEQRTNLQTQSEAFDQSPWSTVGGTTSTNVIAAPDSTTTADLLTENTTTGQHDIRATSPSLTDAVSYTFSVFAKTNGRLLQIIFPITASGHGGIFNLTAGTVTVVGTVTATIQAFPNGWYRCIVSGVKSGTGAVTIRLLTHNGTGNSYTGDGTSGIYLWGAQLEAASFPTSYIPTTTATVTRSADVASITGANFSSWYRQDEGTIYAEGSVPVGVSGSRALAGISDGTNSERIIISHNGTTAANGLVVDGNTSQTSFTVTANSFPPGERKKVALAYKVDDFGFTTVPGTTVEQDSSGTLPTVDRLQIGNAPGRTEPNQPIRRLTYWPQRLSNTTLQQITQ
jgi:hypothetical protein